MLLHGVQRVVPPLSPLAMGTLTFPFLASSPWLPYPGRMAVIESDNATDCMWMP
jgi:hypothetical protein